MSLSKPIYSFLGFYFEQLWSNPIRTKMITSSIIASGGAFTSQQIAGSNINFNTIFAYGAFGGLISGPVSSMLTWLAFILIVFIFIACTLFLFFLRKNSSWCEGQKNPSISTGEVAIRSIAMCAFIVFPNPFWREVVRRSHQKPPLIQNSVNG